jgi:predicted site-specific integrase-resolvase
MDATKWLKPRELAEQEGVSRRTIWTWAEKGIVDVRRRGPRVRVRVRMTDEDDED